MLLFTKKSSGTENTLSNSTTTDLHRLLPSNGSNTVAHLRSCCLVMVIGSLLVLLLLTSNDHIAPSLRLILLNSPQICCHFFFSKCCACDVCDQSCPPFLWLDSQGDYPPTAPSLRPPIPSGSLIRCQSVQVYHQHPSFPIGVGKSSESGQCSYISDPFKLLVASSFAWAVVSSSTMS